MLWGFRWLALCKYTYALFGCMSYIFQELRGCSKSVNWQRKLRRGGIPHFTIFHPEGWREECMTNSGHQTGTAMWVTDEQRMTDRQTALGEGVTQIKTRTVVSSVRKSKLEYACVCALALVHVCCNMLIFPEPPSAICPPSSLKAIGPHLTWPCLPLQGR